jgi:hypothetical protein
MYNDALLVDAFNEHSDEDFRKIAEVTQDNGFMFDLKDQGALEAYNYFKDKSLGYIFSDMDGIEYHYCLENGMIYAYDENADPCMLPEGKSYDELHGIIIGRPERFSSVNEAEVFHKHEHKVVYSGLKQDILDVKRKINEASLNSWCQTLGLSIYCNGEDDKVHVIVSRSDTLPCVSPAAIRVMDRGTFNDLYDGGYDNYLTCNMIAYLYIHEFPDANKALVFDIAKYHSGLFDDYKLEGLDRSIWADRDVIDKLYQQGGNELFVKMVKDSSGKKAIKAIGKQYYADIKKDAKGTIDYFYREDAINEAKNKDDHDWSVDGIAKLTRRIKMKNRTAVHGANSVNRDVEAIWDINQPNPDIDLDKDGEVESEERKQQVHGANVIPSSEKINSMIKKPTPGGATSGGSGGDKSAHIESAINPSDFLNDPDINYFYNGNSYIMLGEAVNPNRKYNKMLYTNLYADRMRRVKDVFRVYDAIKMDLPWIKYAYSDPRRYKFNLIIDTYYYNKSFFTNNNYNREKTVDLYAEMLKRLIQDQRFIDYGYSKQTIFIPILGWEDDPSVKMWLYKESINPISIIYRLMQLKSASLKDIFQDKDVVFLGAHSYFKINFSKEHKGDIKTKFVSLIKKIIAAGEGGFVEPDPEDDTPMGDSPKAITLDIIDRLNTNQNIKIDSMVPVKKNLVGDPLKKTPTDVKKPAKQQDSIAQAKTKKEIEAEKEKIAVTPEPEPTKKASTKKEIRDNTTDANKDELVDVINTAASSSTSTDEAIDKMEEERVAKLIAALAADENDSGQINKARAARMDKVRNDFYKKSVGGKTVKELITEPNNKDVSHEIPTKQIKIDSINEEWNELTYANFDKTYNVNSDIVAILNSMADWTYPIVVRDLDVKDNSTALDYVDLWTVHCEDSFGKRFTLKFDVPKFMNENRYMMLRGNRKTIETQLFLMPILKTDEGDAQIVSNYNKIFIRRFNTAPGKSNRSSDILVRSLKKYKGNNIKIYYGDNSRICSKYSLPIDYIDLAQVYSKIEYNDLIYYFDQDEIRQKYSIDDSRGIPFGVHKNGKDQSKWDIIYLSNNDSYSITSTILSVLDQDKEFADISKSIPKKTKYTYSRARILNSDIPLIALCGYYEGLTRVFDKAGVHYELMEKLPTDVRKDESKDYVKFEDGYLVWTGDQSVSLLMNGLKECNTEDYKLADLNSKAMNTDFVTQFCSKIKTDGLDVFYDCMIDPITKDVLNHYNLPTDFVECLLYANTLLVDNEYYKHTDMRARRIRRAELIAGYVYKAITDAYSVYTIQAKHTRTGASMSMKQSAVIDRILLDPTEKDYSTNNMLTDVESVNAISTKGLTGLNSERAYSLDKRTYDDSMLNVIGMSTGFAGNVGITRQATLDMNVEGKRGYVKTIDNDTTQLNDVKTMEATEALTPMGATHDDPFRTAMTFVQKSKHGMRCINADPLLVTNGADEALPYIASDIFAFKAKAPGEVIELVPDDYMIVQYKNGSKDYINLSTTVQKNSDGGFHIPLKLDTDLRVGSKFKTDEILAYDKLSIGNTVGENDNMAYKVGTLAKVAMLNTDEGFEDSSIMSHRLSDAMACDVIKVKQVLLPKNTNVYNVLSKGTHIEEGDQLMAFQTPYESEDLEILQRNLAGDEEQLSSLGRVPIRAECTGELVDVIIYRTCELDELSPSLKKLVTAYEKPIKAKKRVLEQNGLDTYELPATYKLPATGKLKNVEDGIMIEFCQQYRDVPAIGDKIVWYSANKGVNKGLFPLGEEPYTDLRPNEVIDGFITNTSVNGRMVCSIAVVGALNKLMVELDRTCKEKLGIPFDDTKA